MHPLPTIENDQSVLNRDHLLAGDTFKRLPDLQSNDGLEKASAILRPRERRVFHHLLRDLAIELGAGVRQVAFDVDELLKLVEFSIHLQHRYLLTIIGVGTIVQLNAGVAASQLAAARDPADGGTFIEQVRRVEEFLAFLLDETNTKNLAFLLIGNELRGQHLDDDVSLGLLRVDIGVEVGLTGLDGCLDRIEGVATLCHIALYLPCKLDVIRDIEVDTEVNKFVDAVIVEGVEAFDDEDLWGLDLLRGIQKASHVVVDGLVDGLALLQRLDLRLES
jgi:hypothetical protein